MIAADFLITGAGELLVCPGPCPGATSERGLGIIPRGAVAAREGRIVWVGEGARWRREVSLAPSAKVVEAEGRLVMPGLVECHTHLCFAGRRADEYQQRVRGVTYGEIAAAGGGILSTVAATRAASAAELGALVQGRLDRFLAYGVTTVEGKSGYGLSLEHELRLLEVQRQVAAQHPVDVVGTLLGAHTVPREYAGRGEEYVELVAEQMVPAVAERGLARFCDVFCEAGAFSAAQARRVLETGRRHGLLPKLHADQLTSGGGAELGVEVGAASVDHLDRVSEAGIAALNRAWAEQTAPVAPAAGPVAAGQAVPGAARRAPVAVLLPGATFFLGEGGAAPARLLLDAGIPVALSTDFNPGSSPTQNLWLMTTLGCSQLRMTAAEVMRAVTIEAATALALEHEVGGLEVGKRADILILQCDDHREIPYHYGMNPVWRVYKSARCVGGPAGPVAPAVLTD